MSQYSRINSSGCGLRWQRTFFQVQTERTLVFSIGCSNTTTKDASHHQGSEFVEEDTPGQFRRVRLTCWRKSSDSEALQKEIGLDLSDLEAKGKLDEISLLATKTPISPLPIPDYEMVCCPSCGAKFLGTPQVIRSNFKRHVRISRRHSAHGFECPKSGCESILMRIDNLAKRLETMHGVSSLLWWDPDERSRRIRR